MKNQKFLKNILAVTFASLLTAFTGTEKFVELEHFVNGRTSASFGRKDQNIKTVLESGTRGEIISSKKMKSGNYGLKIQVASGPKKGQIVWVYYNLNNPALKLYDVPPSSWSDYTPNEVSKVEDAVGAETTRDTPAIQDATPGVENGYTAEQKRQAEQAKAEELVTTGIEQVGNMPQMVPQENCTECSTPIKEEDAQVGIPIARGVPDRGRKLGTITAAACDRIINNKGEPGDIGKYMIKLMSSRVYKNQYLKSNAMGKFCPRFNSLTEDQKLLAWTWMWMAVGQREAHCDPDVLHRHSPKLGVGIWAMEKKYDDRSWRGEACKSVTGGFSQAHCTIDIMYQTTLRDGQTARGDRGSYWSTIKDGLADRIMARFELCN